MSEFVQTAQLAPVESTIPTIGHDATQPFEKRLIVFTDRQFQVLLLASLGGTAEQVADLLGCSEEEVTQTRDELIEMHDAPNMAAVVSQEILRRQLLVDVQESKVQLRRRDKIMLDGFRNGLGNAAIGKQLGKSKDTVYKYCPALFKKMGSSGRTHSVRRSYELGVFEIPPA